MADWMNTHMFSELHEIPNVLKKATVISDEECRRINEILFSKNNLILTGMGSSFFLAEIWKIYFQRLGNKWMICVDSADNLLLSHWHLFPDSTILAFSQSWNTQEVDEVLSIANNSWGETFWIYNNPWSKIESQAKNSFLLWVWKEKSPVSTKYIISALSLLYRLAVNTSDKTPEEKDILLRDLELLIPQLEEILTSINWEIQEQVEKYEDGNHFIAIWNWTLRSVAKEVSLKIRETVWVFSAYEDDWQLLHGGINSLNSQTIALTYNTSQELIERLQQRGVKLLHFGWNESSIPLPENNEFLDPLIRIVATQLFIHHLSVKMWIDTDIKLW